MWKAMTSRLNSALKTLLRNIHTILLFVGIAFIATSAFFVFRNHRLSCFGCQLNHRQSADKSGNGLTISQNRKEGRE